MSEPVANRTASRLNFEVDKGRLAGAITAAARTGSPQFNVTIDWPVENETAAIANAVSAAIIDYAHSAIDSVDGENSSVEIFIASPAVDTQRIVGSATTATALGLTLGLALGLGIAFLRYFLDRRLRTAREAEEITALDLLGDLSPQIGPRPQSQPASTASLNDSIRRVRAGVLQRMNARHARTLLVASSREDENAANVAISLATSIAETGARVLFVDADLRDRSMSAHYGFQDGDGLIDLVNETATSDQLLHQVGASSLRFLAAGSRTADAAEFMSHGAVQEKLRQLSADFDVTVIAAPPILAYSDTLALLPVADAVLLVARVGVVHRHALVEAVRILDQLGKRPMGLVTTDTV
ncbi:CpsD/CapB family tyrosine-protein kinase [Cryobacterium sp. Y62]|uniref:CpsD/CapB family tyrosine-protein kinase n=1 Tax=Cryobacterium sp. Y62 TaxID=2048284 RepID=UPI001E32654C|nr:CpsD/CapB family tyrosine-protein kinase [Cryobacterium sp. Y62]